MKEIGDIILNYGLGAVAILALLKITLRMIDFFIKDLSGKIDTLYEIIDELRKELNKRS